MADVRLGIRYRSLRIRLGWRQADLAARCRVSQDLVSLIERGHVDRVAFGTLQRIASELEAELVPILRWRGGDLDRLTDEAHATIVGRTVELLRAAGWLVRTEVTYSVYGERGSIDILAWHASTRTLLVVEVKSDLVSAEETLRKHDEKARLAIGIAAETTGWQAARVARLLILPGLSTQRRRVDRHAAVLNVAYPARGHELRRWLAAPSGAIAGLLFLAVDRSSGGAAAITGKRVRRPAPSR